MPRTPKARRPPSTWLPPLPADQRWTEEILAAAQDLIEHSRRIRRESVEVIKCSVRLRDRGRDFAPD